MKTERLYLEDAYKTECQSQLLAREGNRLVFDQTIIFPGGGGQPRDLASLDHDGMTLGAVTDATAEDAHIIYDIEGSIADNLSAGDVVIQRIDEASRRLNMRMHTALHLLCAAVDLPVTGGQLSGLKGRLDFDATSGAIDKAAVQDKLLAWIELDLDISTSTIDYESLDDMPELVRTRSVKPPRGNGLVRLVRIGDIDVQACGGTHLASTGEIGNIRVGKVENKGRQNRRVTLHLDD